MNSPGDLTREQRLIESIRDLTRSEFIGDDCAVLSSSQLLSTDMLVEDQHFKLSYADLDSIGWKCIAVNLSDIAAMGGLPTALLVSIGWPRHRSDSQFRQLYAGMQECARKFCVKIVGGDITASDKIVCSITAVGQAFKRGALLRSSARDGDIVTVTGDFGASACGLESLMKGRRDLSYPISRHRRPQPRIHQGLALSHLLSRRNENGNAALMDTSDGLADAALQISKASGVCIQIDAEAIPIHSQTRKIAAELGLDPLALALYGGEDFELFACMSRQVFLELNDGLDCGFTAVGRVCSGSGAQLIQDGRVLNLENSQTYQHF
jgi:thiamine-monophosphate kinase